ncbi:penicillin-insensitive murein endopeptidase [Phreatobacter stygius]|uniref:Penicillin-insensitive murein endopeptidase n=1 Tax=Phreatobacter stygius TaxID=1940610 RepID=A0A4D7AVJ3_9HYPH|nr:penicillin-insensitive murein endopeptidase [Phreatobacter stygius]QCI64989.1 penicillin-insensitive murein endopeptidase [Phreatobacter stygius]
MTRSPAAVAALIAKLALAALVSAALAAPAFAQDRGTVNPRPLPPLANPNDPSVPAKEIFGRATGAAPMEARAFGFYSRGCLAGATALSVNGDAWQVMRLSRNRMWGHPEMISFLERFARQVPRLSSWPGILVGDISQPRGGPMITGHASHQIGLDADIWLTPMPRRPLTHEEREVTSAVNMVRTDRLDIEPSTWTAEHLKVIRAAATDPRVERVLVNAAIKKALCREATGNRSWLAKVRPVPGHNYHMHIRITCPAGSAACRPQDPPPSAEGCGAELDWWFTDEVLNPRPNPNWRPPPPITMAGLPDACRQVVVAR